jgi:Mg2+/citrate symporter
MNPVFTGIIKKGKIVWDNPAAIVLLIRRLEGKGIAVSIKRRWKQRSFNQNAYYFGVVLAIIADWMGEENVEDVHESMKAMFNLDRTKKIPVVKSTAGLTTIEFNEYIERIKVWAAKQGLVVPDPNEVEIEV